jgi:hypothetical protein
VTGAPAYLDSGTSVDFSSDNKLVVSGPQDKTVTLDTSSDSLKQLHGLSVSNDWVMERAVNVLWLPPDYRAKATCVAVWNRIVVLGHSSGSVSFLEFEHGPKFI